MTTKATPLSREQGDINLSPLRQAYVDDHMSDPDLFERDRDVFLHQSLSTPVLNVLSRCDGAYIYDAQGRRYLDMHGNGVHNAGFNNDYVIEQMKNALDEKNTFTPRRYTNENAIRLAEKLVDITPDGLSRVLFSPGGSQAIEMALMLSKQVTGKWKTISFWDSYHGTGFGAASVSGERLFKQGNGTMVPGALHVDFPTYYKNPWGFTDPQQVDDEVLRQIETLFEKEGDIACLIGEPISATPVVPRPYFWERVKALCHKHGALLIFDEIIEGFGRTGKMFASEHFVTPDILVLGKTLGGGMLPFAGLVTREEFNQLVHVSIGHYTHEKNGLCATAGLAVIEQLESRNLVANSETLGRYLLEKLRELQSEMDDVIENVQGVGLHIGVALYDPALAERAMYAAMERGVAFKLIESNVITLRPSLVITATDCDFFMEVLREALRVSR